MKDEDFFGKKLNTATGIYGNPAEIPTIRKNQFRVLRSLTKVGKKWLVLVILKVIF